MDLTAWDFEADGPVELRGQWEFYWKQLLEPPDFSRKPAPMPSGFIRLPGYWNGYEIDGEPIGGEGYATCRLTVLLKEPPPTLALRISEISSAFEVFVNGEKLGAAGSVGRDLQSSTPRHLSWLNDFQPRTARLEIILQISNFHHRRGGAWDSIRLGGEEDIRGEYHKKINFGLFLSGSILIMALYHLGLFCFRTENRSYLYFSFFCLLILIRFLSTGDRYLIRLFPGMSWDFVVRLEYFSFYMALPAFVLFLRSIFPRFSDRCLRLVIAAGLLFSLVVAVTPPRFFSHTLNAYELITLSIFVYGLYVILKELPRKKAESKVFLLGFTVLGAAVINDMLHVEGLVHTDLLTPVGFFIFILLQAFLLSFRFSGALRTLERQGKELRKTFEAYRTEIIAHRKSEAALRESEEKYRTILSSIEEGYYETDLQGNLQFFNDSLCRILGYRRRELQGMNSRSLMDRQTAERVYETFKKVYRIGRSAEAIDWELIRKDGRRTHIETSIALMRGADDRPIGFRGLARDISERKKVEEQARIHQQQLMRADKMVALGTLVSGVAHEINNPNNFIMLNVPVLRDAWFSILPILERYHETGGDFLVSGMPYTQFRENLPGLISGVDEGSRRIKQIVEDLRHYVKNESTDLGQSIDVNSIVRSAVSLLSGMIKKATDHFRLDCERRIPPVRGNAQRIEQVIINLIQNACQALSDSSQQICVSTGVDSRRGCVILVVRDEGRGICADIIERVRDPFFTTRQDSGGLGLGLSISCQIVEEHGGSIEFSSRKGEGTSVTVRLPADASGHRRKGEAQ